MILGDKTVKSSNHHSFFLEKLSEDDSGVVFVEEENLNNPSDAGVSGEDEDEEGETTIIPFSSEF